MTDSKRNPDAELRNLWAGLADSIAELPDRDLLAEIRAEGEDPAEIAKEVRQILHDTAKRYRQRALILAREQYRAAAEDLSGKSYDLPTDVADKRELLALLLSRKPELGALTAQWRDLKNIPDSDLDSILEQLAELGVLNEIPPKE